ncbi:hypothetical protein LOK49_LG12G01054 [Camellia lanceoleosa]|uniref:Uncharacterized protein n=1 Tax=Camellia lanceoleosa TaxID=1840588 RepID=A0ACC0FPH4_9ERIC|nr:hypothetical protein LOK49_LG12G01054 [Camellia lanceoleosa]
MKTQLKPDMLMEYDKRTDKGNLPINANPLELMEDFLEMERMTHSENISDKISISSSSNYMRTETASYDVSVDAAQHEEPLQSKIQFARNPSTYQNKISLTQTNIRSLPKADLPGLKKEEVKVEIEDDRVLQISGERKVEKEEKNDTWHRVERSSGKFVRRFRLPENAKMDGVKASMEIYLRCSSKLNAPEQKMK